LVCYHHQLNWEIIQLNLKFFGVIKPWNSGKLEIRLHHERYEIEANSKANDEAPNSRQSAGELMELLVTRFTQGTQTTIEDWIGKYNSLSFKDGELTTNGIDALIDLRT
jgi:hypothetical protein